MIWQTAFSGIMTLFGFAQLREVVSLIIIKLRWKFFPLKMGIIEQTFRLISKKLFFNCSLKKNFDKRFDIQKLDF